MVEEIKKEKEGEEKSEEKIEKAEPTISEDELTKAIKELGEIIKARKAPAEEEEEEEEEAEDEDEEKSAVDNFDEDDTLAKAIEVSDFLKALVGQTETSLEALEDRISSMNKSATKFDIKQIDALESIEKTLKDFSSTVTTKLDGFDGRLKKIEETPVRTVAKSVLKDGKVLEKSFDAGGESTDEFDALSKRKKVDLISKAIADGKIKDTVLFTFEGEPSYQFTDEQKDILKPYMK